MNLMFCTIRCGPDCSQQPGQVSMSRIRILPPPLRVTLPPPSMTMRSPRVMLAVCVIVIVTGSGPQLKVMTSPMTWSGWAVLTAWPAGGTEAWPSGLPYLGIGRLGGAEDFFGFGFGVVVIAGDAVGDGDAAGGVVGAALPWPAALAS